MNTKQYIAVEDKYGAHNYHPLDVVIDKAKGIWVWDVDGRKYLDFLSAYSAVNQGHNHPRIVRALINQAHRLTLTSRAFRNDQLPLLAKELCELTGYEMMLPMNRGAEAVETAVKTGPQVGIPDEGHPPGQGRDHRLRGQLPRPDHHDHRLLDRAAVQKDFGPFTPGFKIIPFGDAEALEKAITPNTAAFLVEPFQAEAGVLIPAAGYLKGSRRSARRTTSCSSPTRSRPGFGRTGKLFACEHEDVQARHDRHRQVARRRMLPVSAVPGRSEVMGVFKPGEHGSTFGGNPAGLRRGPRGAQGVQGRKSSSRNSAKWAAYFMAKLRTIQSRHIKEVRGRRACWSASSFTPRPAAPAGSARRWAARLLCKETHDNVIRFAPPLVITKKDIDWAFGKIKEVFAKLEN